MTGKVSLDHRFLDHRLLDPSLGEIFGQKKLVRDFFLFDEDILVQKYKMGLQTFTFIVKNIDGIEKIIYIQNLEKDFFLEESVYNIDYIKNLNVHCENIFDKEYNQIILSNRSYQSKNIKN